LFQITIQSQIVEIVLITVGISILFAWPFLYTINSKNTVALCFAKDAACSLPSAPKESTVAPQQYSLIAIFSILGGSLLMSSLDLLSMYLSIELQSFALYILATLNKERLSSTSAGLKYFLLGSLSSCFILLGSAIIYSYTGLTQFENINTLMSITTLASPSLAQGHLSHATLEVIGDNNTLLNLAIASQIKKAFTIGLIILIIGFLFKISAAPFYQWAPALYYGKIHEWVKLSNSGDSLKLLIPSNSRKIISGWINQPCMVTSQKIIENEMGYRGSKSVLLNNAVKEQRVDGSWSLVKKTRSLRYTLMGFERSYQVKIPSKQLNRLNFYFSTLTNNKCGHSLPSVQDASVASVASVSAKQNKNIYPWFLTGFIDAEGCFQVSIRQDKKYKTN